MSTQDKIDNYKGSIIQHGHYNDRIYLMQLTLSPSAEFPYELIDLAKTNRYSKIFAKVRRMLQKNFSLPVFWKKPEFRPFFQEKKLPYLWDFI